MLLSDRRRILVPPSARPLAVVEDESSLQESTNKNDSKTGHDREDLERVQRNKLFIRASLIRDAAGSAYLEYRGQKILVLVSGPSPVKSLFSPTAKLSVDVKFTPFSASATGSATNEIGFGSADLERSLADFVFTSINPSIRLAQYPKSGISVNVIVISSGYLSSGALAKQTAASIVTATSMALVDAGIELIDIVTSCAVKFIGSVSSLDIDSEPKSSELINSSLGTDEMNVDTSLNSSASSTIRGVVSYMASRDEVTGFWIDSMNTRRQSDSEGEKYDASYIDDRTTLQLVQMGCEGAKEIRKTVNLAFMQKLSNDS
ncbi:3' exoribonuclease family, domain 1-domain-containing protein [Dipodascopsis uninucleata]